MVWLMDLDPRLKVLTALAFGLLAWRAGPAGLAAYGLGVGWLLWRLRVCGTGQRLAVRGCVAFVAFWTLCKFGLGFLEPGAGALGAAVSAGLLGARLLVLACIGLCLAQAASAPRLGMALAWFLRPVLGRGRAWRAALAMTLLVHFLPLTWEVLLRVKQALALRRTGLVKSLVLWPQAVLRVLAQKTWTQTMAVAVRGLDREEAWRPYFPPQPRAWIMGVALMAAGAVLAWI